MKRLILLFFCIIIQGKVICQNIDEEEFHMGYSIKSDINNSINNISLIVNDSIKNSFYNYEGIKLNNNVNYGKYGIDISKWNGLIDWSKLNVDTIPQKLHFVIVKATQGNSFVDKQFNENFKNAKAHGYLVGAYHFYNQLGNPVTQADNFIKTVNLSKGDLLPIIDVEKNCIPNCDSVGDLLGTKVELIKNLKLFIDIIQKHYLCKVIIYTNESFYNEILSDDFKDDYFWIAKYSVVPPRCFQIGAVYTPSNLCFKSCKKGCWQYSQWGKIKGINGNVDLNFIDNYYLLKWVIK